ncbi:MAG: FAD-dependent oxidoreductase [Propionibacteriaceae bacterium]|jgi:glycine/D-amino acid oxidase-like deaminating enzyme|nr:FAD-dependent oxidoreductase [Propionibacteriaceae bacterium]
MRTDILICGGGLGGIAAALAAARHGARVVVTEPTRWIGGQLTNQLVPLDEHRRIESTGANASYRRLRAGIRDHYRQWYPLTDRAQAQAHLNPGAAWVSPISAEPRVALAVLEAMIAPFQAQGRLTVLLEREVAGVIVDGDKVRAVELSGPGSAADLVVEADYVLDATELGDVIGLGRVEHVTGRESQALTGEPSAPATADPLDMQSATWVFAVDHRPGEDHTIDRPPDYDFYRDWRPPAWGGRRILDFVGPGEEGGSRRHYQFHPDLDDDPYAIDTDHRHMPSNPELWNYRRVIAKQLFAPGAFDSDIVLMNCPQNDYTGGPLFAVPDAARHWTGAKDLAAAFLYWLQTEAPRPDGGTGWPGLRLRPDVAGTADGFAMMPYVRESRRLQALYTIVEQDVSEPHRPDGQAAHYADSVGVGHYYWLDRHATTGGRGGAADRPLPFQIPLRSLIPRRVRNLLAACKNIGTTQITNGCYRLHPVEWSIGEAAGVVAALAVAQGHEPHQMAERADLVADLQRALTQDGVQLRWPPGLGY